MTDIEKQVDDWHEGVRDRVDNLCAVYKCADIKTSVGIIMTADSAVMSLFRALVERAEPDDEEFIDLVADLAKDSLTSIAINSVELLCVNEERKGQLVKDIISIVKTRYELENKLNTEFNGDDDE